MGHKLQPIPGTELTAYVVELLAKHGITTVRDFLNVEIADISKITNLNCTKTEQLRNTVLESHKPARLNLLNNYKAIQRQRTNYGFQIKSCDTMLGIKFKAGDVFEIVGGAGVGKTQFCLTLALNFVSHGKNGEMALYLDTKYDFSAARVFDMLKARSISNVEGGHIMQRILVERVMSLRKVANTLAELLNLLRNGDVQVSSIKLIIIDALSAIWFGHNTDEERLENKYLLSKIANIVHKIAEEHFIAFMFVNLALPKVQPNTDDLDSNCDDADSNAGSTSSKRHHFTIHNSASTSTLGHYWDTIPSTRLLLTRPAETDENTATTAERLIEVTRNCFGLNGGSCRVYITVAGVVSDASSRQFN